MVAVLTPLAELRERLIARRVIVIVGTGVSQQVRNEEFVSWRGLLESGIEFCRVWADADDAWCERARRPLDEGQLLEAASAIERYLRHHDRPKGLMAKWLGSTVATLRVPRFDPSGPADQPAGLIDSLWRLGAPVLTTNYDTLIEDATGAGAVTWRNPAGLQAVLSGSEPRQVGHIHGVWGEADSVVLSEYSYGVLTGDGEVSKALRSVAYAMTLLFVGCGGTLDDPTFGLLREWLFEDLPWSSRTHFLLERTGEGATSRQRALAPYPIRVIEYGDAYTDLEGFVRRELLEVVDGAMSDFELTQSKYRSPAARGIARVSDLVAAGGILGSDDSAALFEAEAEQTERQLGRVHGLLRQLEDRLRGIPPGWPASERSDHHRFYASATALTAAWLEPEAQLLSQHCSALSHRIVSMAAAVSAPGAASLDSATLSRGSILASMVSAAIDTAGAAADQLEQRRHESEQWRAAGIALAPSLVSLIGDLDRLVRRLHDIPNLGPERDQ